jgi:hypothetical protein
MYKPLFNKVLVEIQESPEDKYGKTDDNLGGKAYREGKVLDVGPCCSTADYPLTGADLLEALSSIKNDSTVMWHEGHEAGTVFEENGKQYAFVYWWDLCGLKDE